MSKSNLINRNEIIAKRLAETRMNPYDRERALHILDSADRVADAIIWAKEKIAAFGAYFLKPGLKH